MPLVLFFVFIIGAYIIGYREKDPHNDSHLYRLVSGTIPMIFISLILVLFITACVATFGSTG